MLIKHIFSYFVLMLGSFSAPCVFADASIETKVVEISKTYANSDFVRINCHASDSGLCKLNVSVDGKKRAITLDFRKIGVLPSLDFIRMVGSGEPFFISVTTGFRCRQQEEALMQSPVDASCRVSFDVGGDNKIVWSGGVVIPMDEPVYMDLETRKADLDAPR